jgi:hypothetical protein
MVRVERKWAMPKKMLALDSVRSLDNGLLAAAFDAELQRAVKDLQDRPTDGKKRKVAIIFTLISIDDHADNLAVEAMIKSVIPERISRPYQMTTKQDGRVEFHEDDPGDVEDPQQGRLVDEIDRRRQERSGPDAIDKELGQ